MTQAATKLTAAEASAGHNRPAILTPADLARDFGYLDQALAEIEQQFNSCPTIVEDDEDLDVLRTTVRRLVGAHKRIEEVRGSAKEPYLSAGRVVDAHFTTRKEKLAGWKATIEARAKRYLDKKAAEEQARRDEEARIAAEQARKAAEVQRQAEAARIATEQARLAEEKLADAHDGEHFNALEEAEARRAETEARERALAATATALAAQKAAEAKPADLARTRTGDGLSTLQTVFRFEVVDAKAIKPEQLWEFIPMSEIEKAIGRFVSVHKDQRQLDGVRIIRDTKPRMT